jgi:hypothetical protein
MIIGFLCCGFLFSGRYAAVNEIFEWMTVQPQCHPSYKIRIFEVGKTAEGHKILAMEIGGDIKEHSDSASGKGS